MSYGVFNSAAFRTASGVAVAPLASIEVRRESDNALATIYSSAAGAGLGNPFAADALGRFSLYAAGIALGYKVTVTSGLEVASLRNVPIGNAQYQDSTLTGDAVAAALAVVVAALAAAGGAAQLGTQLTGTGTAVRTQASKNADIISLADFDNLTLNGIADDYAGLQNAVNECIRLKARLYCPQGKTASISAPIVIAKRTGSNYSLVDFEMEGAGYPAGSGDSTYSFRIKPTFKDTFAVGIQGARNVRLKNVALEGLNTFTISGDFHELLGAASTFVAAGCRDSRYSPYAGVAIDPFYSSTPADGGYPGMSSWYSGTQAYSSRCRFEGVSITGFVVGTVLSPNGSSANAENITFDDVHWATNKISLATCQSQSRNVNINNCNSYGNWLFFSSNEYGAQNGCPPTINGLNLGLTKYAFKPNTSLGPLRVNDLYMESTFSLGWSSVGPAGGNSSVKFSGCHFAFLDTPAGYKAIDFHYVGEAATKFDACFFQWSGGTGSKSIRRFIPNASISAQPLFLFDACTFQGTSDSLGGQHMLAQSGNAPFGNQARYSQCRLIGSYGQQILDNTIATNALSDLNKFLVAPGALISSNTDATKLYQVAPTPVKVSLGSVAITDNGNGTATYTAADATILQVGDLIYGNGTQVPFENATGTTSGWWGVIGRITAIVGPTITLSDVPQNYVGNTQNIALIYWPKFHVGTTGDTHTNTTVDNVSQIAAWQNKDRPRGTGIPAGAYIVSGGGTASWVLSKATTGAPTAGIRLYDADVSVFAGTAL